MIITDQSSSPPRYRGSPIISDDQRSSFLDDRSSLSASTRPPTPIIEDDDQHSIRSASTRPPTPILEREQQLTSIRREISLDNNERIEKQIQSIQSILVKQGKQIRAIYELQKTNMEKMDKVYNQLKKINKDQSNELSAKVFAVSNFIFNSVI
jgi:hypothetical protein